MVLSMCGKDFALSSFLVLKLDKDFKRLIATQSEQEFEEEQEQANEKEEEEIGKQSHEEKEQAEEIPPPTKR
jgi:sortase (surface protein transpeptidase)